MRFSYHWLQSNNGAQPQQGGFVQPQQGQVPGPQPGLPANPTSPFASNQILTPQNSGIQEVPQTTFQDVWRQIEGNQAVQPAQPGTQPAAQPQQPQNGGFTQSQLDQLKGLMQSWMPQQPQPGTQPQQPQVQPQAPQQPQQIDTNTEAFKQLNAQFKQVIGVDLAEAIQNMNAMQQQLQQIQPVVSQYTMEQTRRDLGQMWGVDERELTNRLQQVADMTQRVDQSIVAQYDAMGTDGVFLFYEKFVKPTLGRPQMVQFDTSNVSGYAPAEQPQSFDRNQLEQMLKTGQVPQNWDQIVEAYATNRVR